jgi:hypothetical protein
MTDPSYPYTWARKHWPADRLGQPCKRDGRPDPKILRIIFVTFQDGTTVSCCPRSIKLAP